MQYFVTFADNSNIQAFYVDEIHGDGIPDSAVPITIEQWQTYSADPNLYKRAESGDEPCRLKTQQELDDEAAAQPPATPNPIDELKLQNGDLLFRLAQAQNELIANKSQTALMLIQLAAVQGGN